MMRFFKDPKFWHRLRLYLFGFLIGILLVLALFKDRIPSFSSEGRLRDSFEKDRLVLSDPVQRRIDSLGWKQEAFRDSLLKGEFTLLEEANGNDRSFLITKDGELSFQVRMEVVDNERTRAVAFQESP